MKILLPFFDDTTLIFAARMKRLLSPRGHTVSLAAVEPHYVSERQLTAHLPGRHDLTVVTESLNENTVAPFDAVITAKAPKSITDLIKKPSYRFSQKRPAFIAFQPGLEFTPRRGMRNRRHFDAVFLYSAPHRDIFLSTYNKPGQHVSFGHPYFMTPKAADLTNRRNVYFFAQAISPSTMAARRFIVDILVTLATRHPDRDVFLKLRHLPGENSDHVHKEQFPYPDILNEFANIPANLKLTACTMQEALDDAAIAITCTSTAVLDAISAGVPAMIYLDYVENYRDIYSELMRREFSDSGLIADIPQIMDLRHSPPHPEWMRQHFRGDDLMDEIESAISTFRGGADVVSIIQFIMNFLGIRDAARDDELEEDDQNVSYLLKDRF